MARLGKREREAKRALIKGNLANLKGLERSSGTMGSTLELTRVLRHSHTMGAHVGTNVKGSSSTGGGGTRFGGNLKHCDVERTIMVRDNPNAPKRPQKQVWLASERVWKNK